METINKKVRNATKVVDSNTSFDSKLELKIYRTLVEEGFTPEREPQKFHVWEGFKPTVPFYKRDSDKKLVLQNKKVLDVTYTPDFVVRYNGYTIFIEVKPDSFTNDVYPYKEKFFRKFLEGNKEMNPIFLRVGTIRALKEFIEILKKDYNEKP